MKHGGNMKKKVNLLFVAGLVGSVLICSLVLVFLLTSGKKGNDEKVKRIELAASEDVVNYFNNEEAGVELALGEQTMIEENQEDIVMTQATKQEEEHLPNLISGTESKSIDIKSDIKQIILKSSVDDVIVFHGSNKELEITQTYENLDKKDLFTVAQISDKLEISTIFTEDNLLLPGRSNYRKSILEVKLPEGFKGKIDVLCDVGNITIKDELKLEEASINSGVGDIIVEGIQSLNKAEIQSDVGNIKINGAWKVVESTITTGVGKIEINGIWRVVESTVKANVGNISFRDNVEAEKLSVEVEIGNIVIPSGIKEQKGCSIVTELGEILSYK
jgi:hypothetical protein